MSTHVFACSLLISAVVAAPRSLFEGDDIIPGFACSQQGFPNSAGLDCCGGDCSALNNLQVPASAACCDVDVTVQVCCEDPRAAFNNADAKCTPANLYTPQFPNDLARGIEEVCSWTCCPTLAECPQDPRIAPPFTCGQKFNVNATARPTTSAPTAPTAAPTSAPTGAPTTSAPTLAPSSAPTGAPTTGAPTTGAPTGAPTTGAPTLTKPTTAAPTNAPTGAPTVSFAPTVSKAPTVTSNFDVDGICNRRCGSIGWNRNYNRYRSLTKDFEGKIDDGAGIGFKNFFGPYGGPGPYGAPMGTPYGQPYGQPYGNPYGNPYGVNPYSPGYSPMMQPFYGRPACDPYNWNSNWYWCEPPPPPPPAPVMPTDNGPRPTYPDIADCFRKGGRDCRCSCDSKCTTEKDCCDNYKSQCVF